MARNLEDHRVYLRSVSYWLGRATFYTASCDDASFCKDKWLLSVASLDAINTLSKKMVSTPGFNALVLEMWSAEVENPNHYQPWDDDNCGTISGFMDQVFIFFSVQKEKRNLQEFLLPAPIHGDAKNLVSTALKHLHHAFHRAVPNLHCLIWNTHIISALSGTYDPIRYAFLAQHSVSAVTKILVAMTAETPSPTTAPLKAQAITYAFWNVLMMIQSTDGVTWVIQALEAKLLFALVRCEPWLQYMDGDPAQFLYPFLHKLLPNYMVYRSVLCVIEKSLAKIQQLGLDGGKSRGYETPLWKAWEAFVQLAESRLEVLQTAPGRSTIIPMNGVIMQRSVLDCPLESPI